MSLKQRAAVFVALSALVLTGCSANAPAESTSTDPKPSEAAETTEATTEERTLVVYSGRDEELIAPLIEKFEEASGIEIEARYAGSTELAGQLLEEGDATPAQVFLSQDSGALGAIADADLLTVLPDSVTSLVPAEYTSLDGSWVGLTGRARVIAYDSERYTADQVPGDVWKLIEPEWSGKVGIVPSNASFQSFITAMRVKEGDDQAKKWLEGILANNAQIFAKNGELLEGVNSGAVDLGLINHYYWARSEQDPATLRAQLKFGDPGTITALVNVTGAGILAPAAESKEAAEFIEYLVSEEAQTYFVEETYEYPLIDGLDGPAGVPALTELGGPDVDLSELSSLQETVALITEVGLL